MEFNLHYKQYQALELIDQYDICGYMGGIRSGKSVTGAMAIYKWLYERPEEVAAIFTPTYTQLTQMTLKELKKVLSFMGIEQDRDYVVNTSPVRKFGYKSKWPKNHNGVWSFWNGFQIYTFSLKSFFMGAEFGVAWGDEIQMASKEDIDLVLGRMSGSENPKTFYTFTPPRYNPEIDVLAWGDSEGNGKMPLVIGTTYDNHTLKKKYIEGLEKRFDRITFAREVMCQRVTADGLAWLYSFDAKRNVSNEARYQPQAMVYISFDFNTNPIVCTMAHRGYYTKEYLDTRSDMTAEQKKAKLGKRYVHYFDTVLLTPDKMQGKEHIQAIVDVIKEKTPYQWQHKAYIITGDATGRNSNVLARVGATAWSQVIDAFGINIQQIQTPKSNPTHVDARVLCNSFIANYDEVYISPHCKELIQDCEFVKAKPDGHKLKDTRKDESQRADLLDALTYDICTFNKDWIAIKR